MTIFGEKIGIATTLVASFIADANNLVNATLPARPVAGASSNGDDKNGLFKTAPITQPRNIQKIDAPEIEVKKSTFGVSDVCWSIETNQEGNIVATVDQSANLSVYSKDGDKITEKFKVKLGGKGWSTKISPDSKTVATVDGSGRLTLVDLNNPQTKQTLELGETAKSLSFSKDGTLLGIGTEDGLKVINLKAGNFLLEIDKNASYFNVAINIDSSSIFATERARNGTWQITEFSLKKDSLGEKINAYKINDYQICSLEISSNGLLAFTNYGGEVGIIDSKTDEVSISKVIDESRPLWNSSFSPNGKTLATAASNGSVGIYNITDGSINAIGKFDVTSRPVSVRSVEALNDGTILVGSEMGEQYICKPMAKKN